MHSDSNTSMSQDMKNKVSLNFWNSWGIFTPARPPVRNFFKCPQIYTKIWKEGSPEDVLILDFDKILNVQLFYFEHLKNKFLIFIFIF